MTTTTEALRDLQVRARAERRGRYAVRLRTMRANRDGARAMRQDATAEYFHQRARRYLHEVYAYEGRRAWRDEAALRTLKGT